MAPFIPGPHHVKHPMNRTDIMMQPGGFRAVVGGPSIFGTGYCGGYGNYGYGNYGCCNGDDGKLTFGQKVGSFFKGIGNSIKGAVKNLFTPKGFLKAALCVGACMIPGVGPFIAAGLACVGVAKGVGTVINGAQQASMATTDAEAMAAWENIGGGTFTAAASAVALKGAAGAIKANTANAGLVATKGATGSKLGTHWQAAKQTYHNSTMGQVTGAIKNGVKGTYQQAGGGWQGVKAVGSNFKNGVQTIGKAGKAAYTQAKNAAGGGWQGTKTVLKNTGKATWKATKAGAKAYYQNAKANPYTLSGATTLLNPEEANAEFGIYSGYYV